LNWRNGVDRYGSLSIGLHWLMLVLIAAVYACIELRGLFPKGSDPREAMKAWHSMLGLSVLILVCLRIAVQLVGRAPRIRPEPSRWIKYSSKLVHISLYAFMIGMPIAGWLILSSEGKAIPFFGLQIPALIGESAQRAKQIEEIHELGGTIGYFLIGLHAAAALFHHYWVPDNTLLRMLPVRTHRGPQIGVR